MSESIIDIKVEELKNVDLVTVSGRIDSSNANQLDQTLKGIMEHRHKIVINMSAVEYMSSAGLRTLVSTLRECKKHRGNLYISEPSDRVSEVLELAGLKRMFEIYEHDAAAVDHI